MKEEAHTNAFCTIFFAEVATYDGKKLTEPKLPELSAMLEGRKEREAYGYFCHYFLPAVVGKKKWRKAVRNGAKVSGLAMVSDEALGLLLLENSWELWMWIVNGKLGTEPKTRYTTGRGKLARKSSGWSAEGVSRYNNLCRKIAEERKLEKNGQVDDGEEDDGGMDDIDFDSFYLNKQYEYMGWKASDHEMETSRAKMVEEVWVDWN